ncbi:sensor domain-containing diguanylate cyclase [Jeongeupia wiesaeckerbachi]|uniref:sensor domain-containing diguanylate cyclase n=1 Tax=Jeongeupia wiesaeckerbachi TaxID=3051218 RepID=UPI003D8010C5
MGTRFQQNEAERIATLHQYGILDTPPDGAFDHITALAAKLLDVPIAIVSLVDTDRIWFKSHHGLDTDTIDRAPGLCASAILGDLPYVVNDAAIDPRTLSNPLVASEFGLRFYAGIPLQTRDDHNLGTLCCIDFAPREVSTEDIDALRKLATLVMDQMELRLAARRVHALNQDLRQAHEALRIQALHDPLTGLWNRRAILDHLNRTLALSRREQKPVTVLMLDLDRFKSINDNFGHPVGDQVLIEAGRRLKAVCRSSDAVGRLGGEEFLVVLYPSDADRGQPAAERFRQAIGALPFILPADTPVPRLDVTVSIGTCSSVVTTDADKLVKLADDALLAAKTNGRNRIVSHTPPQD